MARAVPRTKRAAAEMDPPPPCHWITFCTTGPRPTRVRCASGCETRARMSDARSVAAAGKRAVVDPLANAPEVPLCLG